MYVLKKMSTRNSRILKDIRNLRTYEQSVNYEINFQYYNSVLDGCHSDQAHSKFFFCLVGTLHNL